MNISETIRPVFRNPGRDDAFVVWNASLPNPWSGPFYMVCEFGFDGGVSTYYCNKASHER